MTAKAGMGIPIFRGHRSVLSLHYLAAHQAVPPTAAVAATLLVVATSAATTARAGMAYVAALQVGVMRTILVGTIRAIGRADIDGNIVTAARVDVPLSIEAAVALRVHHQLIIQVAGASLSSGCCEEQLSSWMRSKLLSDDEYISVESILYAHTP